MTLQFIITHTTAIPPNERFDTTTFWTVDHIDHEGPIRWPGDSYALYLHFIQYGLLFQAFYFIWNQ